MASDQRKAIGKSARKINETTYKDTTWVVPGLIPAGMTLVAARPKTGKSWLTMQIAEAVASSGRVFGQETLSGRVLYLALEDNERRIKGRMQAQGWKSSALDNVDFVTVRSFLQKIGPLHKDGNYKKLYREVVDGKYALVVIDTFNVAFIGLKNADDNQLVTLALQPLQQISLERDIGTIVVDHHNKMSEQAPNLINDVMGSTAKVSISDTIIGLYRTVTKGTLRLMATGKDIEDVDVEIERPDGEFKYTVLGNVIPGLTEKDNDLLLQLQAFTEGARLNDLAEATHEAPPNLSVRLKRLRQAGLVRKTSKGFMLDDKE